MRVERKGKMGPIEGEVARATTPADKVASKRGSILLRTAVLSWGGVVLGLAICKFMVEEFDGSIQIQSAPGAGTTVTILLPAEEQPRMDGAARKGQEP